MKMDSIQALASQTSTDKEQYLGQFDFVIIGHMIIDSI